MNGKHCVTKQLQLEQDMKWKTAPALAAEIIGRCQKIRTLNHFSFLLCPPDTPVPVKLYYQGESRWQKARLNELSRWLFSLVMHVNACKKRQLLISLGGRKILGMCRGMLQNRTKSTGFHKFGRGLFAFCIVCPFSVCQTSTSSSTEDLTQTVCWRSQRFFSNFQFSNSKSCSGGFLICGKMCNLKFKCTSLYIFRYFYSIRFSAFKNILVAYICISRFSYITV